MAKERDYELSSGNVLADLGIRNAEQELLKAKLILQLHRLLKQRVHRTRRENGLEQRSRKSLL